MLTQKKTKAIMLGDTPVKKVMFRDNQIWPEVPIFTPLNFTAQEANSTVQLNKIGEPTPVELEISIDGNIWTDYTIGDAITLANIGDKVYMRNKSETDTGFNTEMGRYRFAMTGKIGASGDVTSLLNKNNTNTLSEGCFASLFLDCTSLTTAPELPATTLARDCYLRMFDGCTNLTALPELPATTLAIQCYSYMFIGCTSIKLSETQTGEYQIPYRIPTIGTGTTTSLALDGMFNNTGGTFTGTPTINTTYYLSNGGSTLLSYEEIKAMLLGADPQSAITELNNYPLEYFNQFNPSHLSAQTDYSYGLSDNGEYPDLYNGHAVYYYGEQHSTPERRNKRRYI